MYSYGPPRMAELKQDDQFEHTYSSYARIRDVALKTCQMQWTIGRSGEKGSGISVLAAHDDDDDFYLTQIIIFNIFLYTIKRFQVNNKTSKIYFNTSHLFAHN